MPEATTTALEYRYRDASNYKSAGRILLSDRLSDADRALIKGSLEDGEFFVAEQVGIPPLYEALYQLSGGPTEDDHGWHEFVAFIDDVSAGDEALWGSASDLASKFSDIKRWDVAMSEYAMGK